jgi:acetoin utilization protein AcuC
VPIGGLHHARRDGAAGFCAINDCGIAIELLKQEYGLSRIGYVDIDAHHGDGIYYTFTDDPGVIIVDFHEDGRYLYPGSGDVNETGSGKARGTKMNIPLPPASNDSTVRRLWPGAEAFLRQAEPQFIILQAGADSLAGDPITDLKLTEQTHAAVARHLCALADELCEGRLLAVGGGGYNRDNLARAWAAVVREFAASRTEA